MLGLLGLSGPNQVKAGEARAGPAARADSLILIYLAGGASQLDMWDMKPGAPAEILGQFWPIAMSAPGVQICEHLPRLSRQMHHCTLVRSMTHEERQHWPAAYSALTGQRSDGRTGGASGYSPADFPGVGAAIAVCRPVNMAALPYVWLPHSTTADSTPLAGMGGGWIGRSRDPFVVEGDPSDEEFAVPHLSLSPAVSPERLARRRQLL
jgi:hypothetical protein